MRVLHCSWYAPPHVGGIEVYLGTLIPRLRALGVGVELLSGTHIPDLGRYDRSLDRHSQLGSTRLATKLESPEVLHFHNLHALDAARGLRIVEDARARWPRARCVLSVHNTGREGTLRAFAERIDEFVVYSPFMARMVSQEIGRRIWMLPYCFPIPPSGDQSEAEATVLQPTRFAWWKGSFHVLAAVCELLRSDWQFTFCHLGVAPTEVAQRWDARAGEYWPGLLGEVLRWHLAGRIQFRNVSSADAVTAIARSRAVVHPTVGAGRSGEPFGIAAAQAVIAGRPLVLSESGHLASYGRYSNAVRTNPLSGSSLQFAIQAASEIAPLHNDAVADTLRQSCLDSPALHQMLYN